MNNDYLLGLITPIAAAAVIVAVAGAWAVARFLALGIAKVVLLFNPRTTRGDAHDRAGALVAQADRARALAFGDTVIILAHGFDADRNLSALRALQNHGPNRVHVATLKEAVPAAYEVAKKIQPKESSR